MSVFHPHPFHSPRKDLEGWLPKGPSIPSIPCILGQKGLRHPSVGVVPVGSASHACVFAGCILSLQACKFQTCARRKQSRISSVFLCCPGSCTRSWFILGWLVSELSAAIRFIALMMLGLQTCAATPSFFLGC